LSRDVLVMSLAVCSATQPAFSPSYRQPLAIGPKPRKFHSHSLDHWLTCLGGLSCPRAGQIHAHEIDGYSAGAVAGCHFSGWALGIRRWKGADLALQLAQFGIAIPTQRPRRIGLGLELVLERLRGLLRLGVGWLP